MDASLFTQSESCSFIMRDVKVYADGSGGVCSLEVVSTPFSALTQFFFDTPSLGAFVENLATVERTLSGEAKLGLEHEEPYVLFLGNGRGKITVSGLLIDSREHMQKLQFSFATDQTSLGPFLAGLREVISAYAA